MLELDKVLVVIDPDRETQLALDKALTLEKLSEFEIKPIACDYSKHLVEGYCFDAVQIPQLMEDYLAERKTALEALTQPLPAQGSSVLADASWGRSPLEPDFEVNRFVCNKRRHQWDLI